MEEFLQVAGDVENTKVSGVSMLGGLLRFLSLAFRLHAVEIEPAYSRNWHH